MRTGGTVYWLHGDHPSTSSGYHLGSASLTTNVSGQKVAELRYLPFGETGWMSGTTPTDRRFTGQREVPAIGLYDYNARMYWPAAGRFVSADSIVPRPGNPQAFNRYAYALNNPLRFTDPSGHSVDAPQPGCPSCRKTPASVMRKYKYWTYKKASPTKAAWKQDKMVKTPWAQVAPEDRHYLQAEGITEGAYNDWVFGEKNETTEMGLFLGSLVASVARLLPFLAKAAGSILTGACADGDCTNEMRFVPELGRKLDFVFGKATGSAHNIQRSLGMAQQMERIGLADTPASRALLVDHFAKVLNDPATIARVQENGRVVRESFLMGPYGGVKFETVWDGAYLITVKIYGGGR